MQSVWALIIGEPEDLSPTCHLQGTVDFESAAHSQIVDFIEASDGAVKRGAVLVWTGEAASRVEKTFDWAADFEMPDVTSLDEDDEIEVPGSIELTERI